MIKLRAFWTKEEDEVLRNAYACKTRQELESLIPRHTWVAIRTRAKVMLGIHRRGIWRLKSIEPVDAAWLASAIDGEGCLSFHLGERMKGSDVMRFRGDIEITNNSYEYLQRAKDIVGSGAIALTHKDGAYSKRRTQTFMYTLGGIAPSAKVLEQIYPYLIIKREKAEIMIAAGKLIRSRTGPHHPGGRQLAELHRKFRWLCHWNGREQPRRLDLAQWMVAF